MIYKVLKNKAFTLIELLIVISIMMIVLIFSYSPYNMYQNKARLKLATREVAQSLYEARNMAVSWVQTKDDKWEFKNKSVWILLSSEDWKNENVYYYFYNHDLTYDSLVFPHFEAEKIKNIQDWVYIVWFSSWEKEFKNILLFYKSVKWEVKVIWFDDSWNKTEITSDTVKIKFSFKKSNLDFLKKEITYYLKTNIVDYK